MRVETKADAEDVWNVIGRTAHHPRSLFDGVVEHGDRYFRYLFYKSGAINSVYFTMEPSDEVALVYELYSDYLNRDFIVQEIVDSLLAQKRARFNTVYDGVPLSKYDAPYVCNDEILVCKTSEHKEDLLPDYDGEEHKRSLKTLLTEDGWYGKKQLGELMEILSKIRNKVDVVKLEGKKVIGYGGAVYEPGGRAYIPDVYVHEGHRGKGVGKEIVQSLLSKLHKKGIKRALLDTESTNEAAMALYRGMGFRNSGRYFNVFEMKSLR
jgi:ribosomal protein S18 acetylase RimI-like enzyme